MHLIGVLRVRFTLAVLALATLGVIAQDSPVNITITNPQGCNATGQGRYEMQNIKATTSKRSLERRLAACSSPNAVIVQLSNGILTDDSNRVGEILANHQFLFENSSSGSQAGTLHNSGWAICSNNSLAIGPTTVFYQCPSGRFWGIYDKPVGNGTACSAIHSQLILCTANSTSTVAANTSTSQATTITTTAPTTTTISTPNSPTSSSQLTIGTKVTIGVVVPLAMISLMFLMVLLGRRTCRGKTGTRYRIEGLAPDLTRHAGVLVDKEPGVAVT